MIDCFVIAYSSTSKLFNLVFNFKIIFNVQFSWDNDTFSIYIIKKPSPPFKLDASKILIFSALKCQFMFLKKKKKKHVKNLTGSISLFSDDVK